MKYIYSCKDTVFDEEFISSMSQKFVIDKRIIRLLFARGFNTEEKLYNYFNPSLKQLHNPFLLEDMKQVVDKINYYVKNNKKILVYGDYDTDGITATATMFKFLSSIGADVSYFIPNRFVDGYGLNIETIDKAIKGNKPDLLISVDCGITAVEEVKYLKSLNIDVIITDHHERGEELPDCLIINPKISKTYPFNQLCGAGVALKLVQAMAGIDEASKYLSTTAIATISDIVDLVDENRSIVALGLKDVDNLPKGLLKMITECGISKPLKASDIAFKLAPKINASGRMGDASLSLDLYLKTNTQEINQTCKAILEYNVKRQQLCNDCYNEIKENLKDLDIYSLKSIIMSSPNWEMGIVGIVAARICEEYNRPTCIFCQVGDKLTGSCRSVNGVNVHSLMCSMSDILEKFGGHTMAAGVTVNVKHYDEFCSRFNKYVQENLQKQEFLPTKTYDLELDLNEITTDLIEDIDRMEPCGHVNFRPIFKLRVTKADVTPMKNHPEHLLVKYPNLSLLAFNSKDMQYILSSDTVCDVLADINIEVYRNTKKISGIVKNIDYEDIYRPKDNHILTTNYLKQLSYNDTDSYKFNNYTRENLIRMLVDMDKNIYGTLFVAYDYNTYLNFKSIYDSLNIFRTRLFEITDETGINTILLAPKNFNKFNTFNRIIFLDPILHTGYLSKLNKCTKGSVFLPHKTQFSFSTFREIETSRTVFGKYFRLLEYAKDNKIKGSYEYDFYIKLVKAVEKAKEYNYLQFYVCLTTFVDLGLIEMAEDNSSVLKINNVKKPLNASAFYNRLNLVKITR